MNEEKLRGLLASSVSSVIAWSLNLIGNHIGVDPDLSSFIASYVIGNLLTYSFDIIFAKKHLSIYGESQVVVPYSDMVTRLKWVFKSFFSVNFFRFVLTVIIDSLIGLAIRQKVINLLDKHNIYTNHKMIRDMAVTTLVVLATFFLYVNTLRFNWAYTGESNPVIDVIVVAWSTILIMFYVK